jgi:hypothetical protein
VKFAPILASLLLAGCTLIDQRTFAPSPEAEPIPVVPGAPVRYDPRTPLISIDFASPSPNYRDLLRLAVRAAESRNGSVQFDVVAVTPLLEGGAPPQAVECILVCARIPPSPPFRCVSTSAEPRGTGVLHNTSARAPIRQWANVL